MLVGFKVADPSSAEYKRFLVGIVNLPQIQIEFQKGLQGLLRPPKGSRIRSPRTIWEII